MPKLKLLTLLAPLLCGTVFYARPAHAAAAGPRICPLQGALSVKPPPSPGLDASPALLPPQPEAPVPSAQAVSVLTPAPLSPTAQRFLIRTGLSPPATPRFA